MSNIFYSLISIFIVNNSAPTNLGTFLKQGQREQLSRIIEYEQPCKTSTPLARYFETVYIFIGVFPDDKVHSKQGLKQVTE